MNKSLLHKLTVTALAVSALTGAIPPAGADHNSGDTDLLGSGCTAYTDWFNYHDPNDATKNLASASTYTYNGSCTGYYISLLYNLLGTNMGASDTNYSSGAEVERYGNVVGTTHGLRRSNYTWEYWCDDPWRGTSLAYSC